MSATMTPPIAKTVPELPDQWAPQRRRFSREEYYRMAEEGYFRGQRVERIHGEILVMSPIGWKHSLAKLLASDVLKAYFGREYFVQDQDPFPTNDSDPQPDIAIIPGDPRTYQDHPRHAALIVEVADSSIHYDTGKKAQLYAGSGVTDYWVLDLVNLQVVVYRDPQPDATSEFQFSYRSRTEYRTGQTVVPLATPHGPGVAVADMLP